MSDDSGHSGEPFESINDESDTENTEFDDSTGEDVNASEQFEEQPESSSHTGLWVALGVALIGALVFWWIWRNKREQLASAAAQVNKHIQTGARSGAAQAQDLLDSALSKASDVSETALRNVAQSAPAQHAQHALVSAPGALADSLDQISEKLREQTNA